MKEFEYKQLKLCGVNTEEKTYTYNRTYVTVLDDFVSPFLKKKMWKIRVTTLKHIFYTNEPYEKIEESFVVADEFSEEIKSNNKSIELWESKGFTGKEA